MSDLASLSACVDSSRAAAVVGAVPPSVAATPAGLDAYATIFARELEQLRHAATAGVDPSRSGSSSRAVLAQDRLAALLTDCLKSVQERSPAEADLIASQWGALAVPRGASAAHRQSSAADAAAAPPPAPPLGDRMRTRVTALQQGVDPAAWAAHPAVDTSAPAAAGGAGAEAEIETNFTFGFSTN